MAQRLKLKSSNSDAVVVLLDNQSEAFKKGVKRLSSIDVINE